MRKKEKKQRYEDYTVNKEPYELLTRFGRSSSRYEVNGSTGEIALDCPLEEGDAEIPDFRRRIMNVNWKYSYAKISKELCFAARWNRQAMLCRILDAHPELINQTEALSVACLGGHLPCVSILKKQYGEDVNRKPLGDADYPIFQAIFSGNVETVNFLLEQGATLEVRSSIFNESPIQYCQRQMKNSATGKLVPKYIPIFKVLVDASADLNEPHPIFKQSPLEFAKKLEGNPEHLEEIRAILSQKPCSLEAIEVFMAGLALEGQADMDLLLYTFAALSTFVPGEDARARP